MAGLECRQGLLPREYGLGRFGTVEVCGERIDTLKLDTVDNRTLQGRNDDLQFTDMDGNVFGGMEARQRLGLSPVDLYTEEVLKRYLTSPLGIRGLLAQVDPQQLVKTATTYNGQEIEQWQKMGAYFLSPAFYDKWCSSKYGLEAGETNEKVNLASYGMCGFESSRALLNHFFSSEQRARLIQETLQPLQKTVQAVRSEKSSAALEFRAQAPLFMNYVSLTESMFDLLFVDSEYLARLVDAYAARFSQVAPALDGLKERAEALIAQIMPDHRALQTVGACFGKSAEHDGVKVWEMSHQCYSKMQNVIAHGHFASSREKVAELAQLAQELREHYPNYATQLVNDLEMVSLGHRMEPAYMDSNWYHTANALPGLAWVNQALEIHCDEEDDDCDEDYPRLSWDPAKNKIRFETRQLSAKN